MTKYIFYPSRARIRRLPPVSKCYLTGVLKVFKGGGALAFGLYYPHNTPLYLPISCPYSPSPAQVAVLPLYYPSRIGIWHPEYYPSRARIGRLPPNWRLSHAILVRVSTWTGALKCQIVDFAGIAPVLPVSYTLEGVNVSPLCRPYVQLIDTHRRAV